eukprot:TRINITY_DN9639_c4_g1_i1.p1 TRINITY_DN9639_c4_g1~~TRINITY_DN9639_c4_g1_i1.p1  ORF type:complete len:1078 (+),score=264.00 TRINITY_DN9639_c4_g1_i1:70-3234(+)
MAEKPAEELEAGALTPIPLLPPGSTTHGDAARVIATVIAAADERIRASRMLCCRHAIGPAASVKHSYIVLAGKVSGSQWPEAPKGLRPYQKLSVEALRRLILSGAFSAVLRLEQGLGKRAVSVALVSGVLATQLPPSKKAPLPPPPKGGHREIGRRTPPRKRQRSPEPRISDRLSVGRPREWESVGGVIVPPPPNPPFKSLIIPPSALLRPDNPPPPPPPPSASPAPRARTPENADERAGEVTKGAEILPPKPTARPVAATSTPLPFAAPIQPQLPVSQPPVPASILALPPPADPTPPPPPPPPEMLRHRAMPLLPAWQGGIKLIQPKAQPRIYVPSLPPPPLPQQCSAPPAVPASAPPSMPRRSEPGLGSPCKDRAVTPPPPAPRLRGNANCCLVISSSPLVADVWEMELTRWAPHLTVARCSSYDAAVAAALTVGSTADVVVLSPSGAKQADEQPPAEGGKWRLVVCDGMEPLAQQHPALPANLKADSRLLLAPQPTNTRDSALELLHGAHFLLPTIVSAEDAFTVSSMLVEKGVEEQLRSWVSALMLPLSVVYRRRDALCEVPLMREAVLRAPLSELQQKLAEKLPGCADESLTRNIRDSVLSREDLLQLQLNPRGVEQALEKCEGHPLQLNPRFSALLPGGSKYEEESLPIDAEILLQLVLRGSGKMDALRRVLQVVRAARLRTVVYVRYPDAFELLRDLFEIALRWTEGSDHVFLMPPHGTASAAETFSAAANCVCVVLLSESRPVDLSAADAVVFFDSDPQPARSVCRRRLSSLHRWGQTRPVRVVFLVARGAEAVAAAPTEHDVVRCVALDQAERELMAPAAEAPVDLISTEQLARDLGLLDEPSQTRIEFDEFALAAAGAEQGAPARAPSALSIARSPSRLRPGTVSARRPYSPPRRYSMRPVTRRAEPEKRQKRPQTDGDDPSPPLFTLPASQQLRRRAGGARVGVGSGLQTPSPPRRSIQTPRHSLPTPRAGVPPSPAPRRPDCKSASRMKRRRSASPPFRPPASPSSPPVDSGRAPAEEPFHRGWDRRRPASPSPHPARRQMP